MEPCQLNYFTDQIRHLLTDDSFRYLREPIAALRWFFSSIVILMSVSSNTSFTLSFMFGFAINHRFLSFEKWPKSEPRVLNMSHHLLIFIVKPAPPASSANEPCFAVDTTCRHVIRGWILGAQRAIAIGFPCAFPSTQWQDLFTTSDKLIIVSTSSRKRNYDASFCLYFFCYRSCEYHQVHIKAELASL